MMDCPPSLRIRMRIRCQAEHTLWASELERTVLMSGSFTTLSDGARTRPKESIEREGRDPKQDQSLDLSGAVSEGANGQVGVELQLLATGGQPMSIRTMKASMLGQQEVQEMGRQESDQGTRTTVRAGQEAELTVMSHQWIGRDIGMVVRLAENHADHEGARVLRSTWEVLAANRDRSLGQRRISVMMPTASLSPGISG